MASRLTSSIVAGWARQGSPSKMADANRLQTAVEQKAAGFPAGHPVGGVVRDSRHVSPSLPRRLAPKSSPASEMDAQKSGPVEFLPGSRDGKLGVAKVHRGLAGRDVRRAALR